MSQLPRYESYKDSGVQWLGEIPSHWDVKQLKFAVTCNDEALGENTEPDYEMLYVDISSVSLTDGIKHKEELLFESAPSRARRVVKSGDVLVSTVRTYLKAITYVESAEKNLIASTGFAVLRPSEKFDSKFIGYWIQSEGMLGNIVANSVGVSYPAINSTDLVRLPIVELPLSEQKFIADFLDKRLAQVDALIAKQETLLEKLAEQRVALISHAVTKGLNPDVEMKESGIDYLGKIPKNWKVVKLSRVFSIKAGGDVQEDKFSRECSEDYPYPIYTNANDAKSIYGYTNEARYPSNSITVSGRGEVGFAVYRDHSFDAIIRLLVMMPYQEVDCRYYTYLINAVIDFQVNSSAVNQLSTLQIAPYKVLLFSGSDQKKIADYLDVECGKIDGMTQVVEKTISKLQEYRSTLITQVVTGKIDVRNLKVN